MTEKHTLTRRRLLAGTGFVGAGLASGGAGTFAMLSDRERTEDNSISAGTLDLELDWVTYYHGRTKRTDSQRPTSNPGPMFALEDCKPGDCGGGVISIYPKGNPAYVHAELDITESAEDGFEEPEPRDDRGSDGGDLAERIRVVAKPAGYLYPGDPGKVLEAEKDQFIRDSCPDPGEYEESDCYFLGPLTEMASATDPAYFLDGGLDPLNSPNETHPMEPGATFLVSFVWWLPTSLGNRIQGDSVTFDLSFTAVQARHLDDPENYDP